MSHTTTTQQHLDSMAALLLSTEPSELGDERDIILESMAIELIAKRLLSPTGRTNLLLSMRDAQFMQRVEALRGQPSSNGNHHQVQRSPHKQLGDGKARQGDPWSTEQWRQEILSFALAHGGAFKWHDLPYNPAEHGGIPSASASRAGAVVGAMVAKGILKKLGNGAYKTTPLASKWLLPTAQLALPVAAEEKASNSTPAEPSNDKRRFSPMRDQVKDALLSWGADHEGAIVLTEFRKRHHELNASGIYDAIHSLEDEDRLERVSKGRYRLVGEAKPESKPSTAKLADGFPQLQQGAKPRGYWDTYLIQVSDAFGRPWQWKDLRERIKFSATELQSMYNGMHMARNKGVMKQTAEGFVVVDRSKAAPLQA